MKTFSKERAFNGEWETEYPFEGHYVDLGKVDYHFVDTDPSGEKPGPTLLFLHGNPTWSFYWRHQIAALQSEYRCIAPDHMGCGLSDKPQFYPYSLEQHIANVKSLVVGLDLREIVLVVHDWGGAIGMGLANEIADRVKGFVICNTAAFPSRHMPDSIGLCRIPVFGSVAIRGFNAFVKGALAWCSKKGLTSAAKAGYLAPYDNWANRVANLRFVQDIPMSEDHPSWSKLTEIEHGLSQFADHPIKICWGAHDFCFHDKFLDEWKLRLPKADVRYFEDAGHFVAEDAYEEVTNAVREIVVGVSQLEVSA
ncbi:MAG: alpha/beta fold hydrolase [Planctomycetota bacterium]